MHALCSNVPLCNIPMPDIFVFVWDNCPATFDQCFCGFSSSVHCIWAPFYMCHGTVLWDLVLGIGVWELCHNLCVIICHPAIQISSILLRQCTVVPSCLVYGVCSLHPKE